MKSTRMREIQCQTDIGTRAQEFCLIDLMRLSPLLSCVLLVGLGGMFLRAAQTASGECHEVCIPCPLCLCSGLASADTRNKTQFINEFPLLF